MNEPHILKQDQISDEILITNEIQILKEHKISKETQITNKPQILKDHQIKKKNLQINPIFQKNPKFPMKPKL
jgi:hypothetical protein